MSIRLNRSSIAYVSPRTVHNVLKTFLTSLAIYLILRRHLPDYLNISSYVPNGYMLLFAVTITLCKLSLEFNLPAFIASCYARYQQNRLRELIEPPIATLAPPTTNARILANYRDNIFNVLKRKVEKENYTTDLPLEDLPSEVKENLSIKKIQ